MRRKETPDAVYNAETNAIIAKMQEDNRRLMQEHTSTILDAVQGGAASPVIGQPAIPPIGQPTIPPPEPVGYIWMPAHTALGLVGGWIYTGLKATPEQIAAIKAAEDQLAAVKKAAGLI